MVRIVFMEANGRRHDVDVAPGVTLMQAALDNRVPGIVAECGGNCACGTCCVYVDAALRERTGQASEVESATMEVRDDSTPGRRLSCQITVSDDLDGLLVRIPESQF